MTDEQRRYIDAFIRIVQFGIDEGASYPPVGTTSFDALALIIENYQASSAEQSSAIGDASEKFELKDIKREELREMISVTSRTAKAMRYEFPGIEEQFAMPKNRTDADILATARAFVTNGTPLIADFGAYGLVGTWFDQMTTAANEFEATFGPAAAALADRAEATAELQDWIVQGMRHRRILDGVSRNIFANNVGKLAAWIQASHIERPPKKKEPAPPEPPPEPPTP